MMTYVALNSDELDLVNEALEDKVMDLQSDVEEFGNGKHNEGKLDMIDELNTLIDKLYPIGRDGVVGSVLFERDEMVLIAIAFEAQCECFNMLINRFAALPEVSRYVEERVKYDRLLKLFEGTVIKLDELVM